MAAQKAVSESETMVRLKADRTRVIQDANTSIKQIKQKCDARVRKLDTAIAGKRAAEAAALEVLEDVG